MRSWARIAPLLAVLCLAPVKSAATDWYVSTTGSSTGTGAVDSPWDIGSALDGSQAEILPGDTLWFRGGTYQYPWVKGVSSGYGYRVVLVGTPESPINIRPFTGERVIIDGGLDVVSPAAYLWIRDFELLVSQPKTPNSAVDRPDGGLRMLAGEGCKYINLVVHDNNVGIGFWTPAVNSEIYGCLIYNNGWVDVNGVGNGPGIYTQNGTTAYKHITDNFIMANNATYGLKAYSTKAYVNNFVIEGNIIYEQKQNLIGGGGPSANIFLRNNYTYGPTMEVGYNYYYGFNQNCEVTNNVIGNNRLIITRFLSVVNTGNQVVPAGARRPKTENVKFRVNRYDANRGHLAIFNWPRKASVSFSPGAFLQAGDTYRLMDPKNFYGAPVYSGVYNGTSITVPMNAREFAAYVVLK